MASIGFDNPTAAVPTKLVDVGGRSILVGSTQVLGVGSLAPWELGAGASVSRIPVESTPRSLDLSVDDARVVDGRILIGGITLDQNVVWEVELPE